MESLLVEEEVLWSQTGITAEKDPKFSFDGWIALKYLTQFPKASFLVVPMESLLVEEEVLSRKTATTAEKFRNL